MNTAKTVTLALLTMLTLVTASHAAKLSATMDEAAGKITVYREGIAEPLVTQNARPDFRPYLHPILAPDGKGELTQLSPEHHKHQTGLFWGFPKANGRDFFHNPGSTHWKRVAFEITEQKADRVKWRTVYNLLRENGKVMLTETQEWTMWVDDKDRVVLDLKWRGNARGKDVKVSKSDYGGLFLRMPWEDGKHVHVVDAARNRDKKANGKRSMWLDVGMEIEGRDDEAHIAIFDHPGNQGFPNAWRVDDQFGVGPSLAIQQDWLIRAKQNRIFQHRLIVYTGDLNDQEITDQWKAWTGQKYTSALWVMAQEEARDAKFLSPDEAVAEMTVQDGFEVNAFAHEPMITQPMAFCWDDRGRLWVAENRDYESRGHGFSKFGDSRILILEDTDRDGVADSRKVFLEGVPFPAAIAVGMGGLWLGAPPNLLFVPDKNGDDKADVDDIEVRLTGWGIRDRHETLNSFHWGPDGWLYGLQGYATPSKVGKPKGKGKLYKHRDQFPKFEEMEFDGKPVDINGGVWRYHPTKDRFEVVAHGFSNPWGIDYDAKGQIFITACVIPHLWHVIPGGIYHRQGGAHFNPHAYSDIRTIADHRHRSAHGGARIYNSDAYPQRYQGQLFMANIHEHAVLVDKLEPSGSGYIGRHGENFLDANNAQWIGFSMEIGPDGNVYVLDWHDADICGKTVAHKETGRIFRIAPKESLAKNFEHRYADLNTLEDAQLVELQLSKSAWHARRARVILQDRAARGALDVGTAAYLLTSLDLVQEEDIRLRMLWTLHVIGAANEELLLRLLDDHSEHIRAWAVQLLCEDRSPPRAAIGKFVHLAVTDESAVVRLSLASALQRIEEHDHWRIVSGLLTHPEDNDDHNLPKMIWFGFEPMVAKQPAWGLDHAGAGAMPVIQNYTARRAVQTKGGIEAIVLALAGTFSNEAKKQFLAGALDGIGGGGKKIPAPLDWPETYEELKKSDSPEIVRLAKKLAQRFGDDQATAEMLAAVGDTNIPIKQRQEAIRGLAAQRHQQLAPQLAGLLDDQNLRIESIRAIAAFDDEALADELLKRYDTFDAEAKRAALQTLAARPKSGWKLAQAIKAEKIPRADIPAYIPRQLRRVVGSGFVEIWGPIDELPAAKAASFEKYRELLTEEAIAKADPQHGKAIFARSCLSCHKMYGEGGEIGPDITGANRGDLNYVLDNLLDPSAEIPEGYQLNVITMTDGRNYGGTVASETDAQIVLRQAAGEPVTIEKANIQSREKLDVSMMPEGLLATLKDDEVLALVRYLRTSEALKVDPLPDDPHFEPYELTPVPAVDGSMLEKGDHLAICGDSITEQKRYSLIIETYLTACMPELEVTCRQFGWSGEQAGRFLTRMENDVLRFKPDVATTCYGMNDFRYVPFDPEIAAIYRNNLTGIIEKFHATDCEVLLGSPGIIDSVPSWVKSATGTQLDLNVALSKFRNLGVELANEKKIRFADVYRPMLIADFEAKKAHGETFKVAGKDGVHPGWAGQVVMAYAFLEGLGLDGDLGTIVVDGDKAEASGGHEVTAFADGRLTLKSKRLPFSAPPGDVGNDDQIRAGLALVPFHEKLNRMTLKMLNPSAPSYTVKWGAETREYSAEQLKTGVNLAADFVQHPLLEPFQKVQEAVAKKQTYETRQMKTLMHGPEGGVDMEATVALTEKVHAKFAAALKRSLKAVEHVIEIKESGS